MHHPGIKVAVNGFFFEEGGWTAPRWCDGRTPAGSLCQFQFLDPRRDLLDRYRDILLWDRDETLVCRPRRLDRDHIPACPPRSLYSVTQDSAKMQQNTSFSHQKSENFLGSGHTPPQTSFPWGGDIPLPIPHPSSAPTTTRSWLRHCIIKCRPSVAALRLSTSLFR